MKGKMCGYCKKPDCKGNCAGATKAKMMANVATKTATGKKLPAFLMRKK